MSIVRVPHLSNALPQPRRHRHVDQARVVAGGHLARVTQPLLVRLGRGRRRRRRLRIRALGAVDRIDAERRIAIDLPGVTVGVQSAAFGGS